MLRMAGGPMVNIFHYHCVYTYAPLYFKNDSKLRFWFDTGGLWNIEFYPMMYCVHQTLSLSYLLNELTTNTL